MHSRQNNGKVVAAQKDSTLATNTTDLIRKTLTRLTTTTTGVDANANALLQNKVEQYERLRVLVLRCSIISIMIIAAEIISAMGLVYVNSLWYATANQIFSFGLVASSYFHVSGSCLISDALRNSKRDSVKSDITTSTPSHKVSTIGVASKLPAADHASSVKSTVSITEMKSDVIVTGGGTVGEIALNEKEMKVTAATKRGVELRSSRGSVVPEETLIRK